MKAPDARVAHKSCRPAPNPCSSADESAPPPAVLAKCGTGRVPPLPAMARLAAGVGKPFESGSTSPGRRPIVMDSRDHLGMMNHPRVIAAAIKAIRRYGTGCAGSRFLNGTLAIHEQLEAEIATFLEREAAIVFPTGFQANLGAIAALVRKNDHVLIDESCHASVVDGARLSLGRVERFARNDHRDLARKLETSTAAGSMVVVSGVADLTGDIAALPDLSAVCRRHRAALMVDDSHAIGILGDTGAGLGEHFGLAQRIELISVSCAAGLATIGGFLAADSDVIDYLRHHARPLIFSASLPPAQAATALTALRVIRDEPERRARLWRNVHYLRTGLRARGFDVTLEKTPLVVVHAGSEAQTLKLWRRLLDHGIAAEPLVYPLMRRDRGLLRVSCVTGHALDELDRAISTIARCVPTTASE